MELVLGVLALAIAVVGIVGTGIVARGELRAVKQQISALQQAAKADVNVQEERIRVAIRENERRMAQITAQAEGSLASMRANFGRMLMIDGKLDEAVEMITGLLEQEPSNVQARWYRGQCYERQGEWAWAAEDYGIVHDADLPPGLTKGEVNFALGRIFHNMGRHPQAVSTLKTARDFGVANRVELLLVLGDSQRLGGDAQGALATFGECIDMSPRNADAAVGYAYSGADLADSGLRQWDEVEEWLSRIMERHPEGLANYLQARAIVRLRHGQQQEAIADLDSAIRINPGNNMLYQIKGRTLLEASATAWLQGEGVGAGTLAKEAVSTLKQALGRTPLNYRPVFHNLLVQGHLLAGDIGQAEREGRLSVGLKPDYWQNHSALLMALAWKSDWSGLKEAAERALAVQEAVQSRPGHAWLRFYHTLALLAAVGSTPDTKQSTLEFLDQLGRTFSPALFSFWPVLRSRLRAITSGPAQRFVDAFDDVTAATHFAIELRQ